MEKRAPTFRVVFICYWLVGVFALWLFPLLSPRVRKWEKSYLPLRWSYQQSVAELFTRRVPSWSDPVVLIRSMRSPQNWNQVPLQQLSQVMVAGVRNRLGRLIGMFDRANDAEQLYSKLALFVVQEIARQDPSADQIEEVRFARVTLSTKSWEMTHPDGAWAEKDYSRLPDECVRLLAAVAMNGRQVVSVRKGEVGRKFTRVPIETGGGVTPVAFPGLLVE